MDQLVDNARLCCYLLPWPVEPLKRVSEHGPPSTAINPAGHIWRGNDPIRQRHEGLRQGHRRAGAREPGDRSWRVRLPCGGERLRQVHDGTFDPEGDGAIGWG